MTQEAEILPRKKEWLTYLTMSIHDLAPGVPRALAAMVLTYVSVIERIIGIRGIDMCQDNTISRVIKFQNNLGCCERIIASGPSH